MSTTLADAAKSAPGEAVTAAMLTMAAQLDEAVKAAGHGLLALAQAAVGAESAACGPHVASLGR